MKNKNFIPIIVIFIVSLLYNFPALLGMVDTPFDIRDVRMYPWRYHNVDQKIQKETLWEGKFPKDKKLYNEAIRKDVFKLQVLPGTSSQIAFNINVPNISKVKKEKLSDFNFYLSFDYKEETLGKGSFKFGLSLLNTTNGTTYTPGFAVLPLSVKSGSNWYRTTFNLNKFVNELLSIDNINNYRLIISGENNDKISNAYLYLTDIKLLIEDFSFVPKVHNHFNNDLIQFFTPAREYYSNTIKKLKLPFWNNYTFTGSEFLAEPQIGFFHPLYFLIYFVFDHFTAHQLITFLMLFLCGIGAFVLSAYWGLNPISSLLASIVYMFQPANATWYSYEHTLMNTAMLPFLIYGYERHLEKNRLFSKYLLFAALIMGLIFLSGHLQRVYYSIIFFVLFAVFKLVVVLYKTHKVSLIYLTGLFFVLVMGVLIGAVVVVPFIPLYLESHRAAIPDS
ncbi:MAG: hypothetical protein HYR97_00970, partial [Candidatus Melainabacteria bacterium]|nr:hypothetical protein [Candidatus Melainabacteria bacterium]